MRQSQRYRVRFEADLAVVVRVCNMGMEMI